MFFPQEELRAQKSSLEQQGIVIATSPATKHCPRAVTAFVMAGTSHTQELPMPQRCTSPKLAAQSSVLVTQTLLFPPKPVLAPGCWQLSPKQSLEECHLKRNPKITHSARTLQSPHLLNELPPSSTHRGNQHRVSTAAGNHGTRQADCFLLGLYDLSSLHWGSG